MVDPHSLLANVHPDLVKVFVAAAQAPQPFQIVQGLRTVAAEQAAVASGHSQTMQSRHLASRYGGKALAVDIVCMTPEGGMDWAVATPEGGCYGIAAEQVLDSAKALGVAVQWGGQAVGAWVDGVPSHFRDWGHFQLDPARYPG